MHIRKFRDEATAWTPDDGYAILQFWVDAEKLPGEDGTPSKDDPSTPTLLSPHGACGAGPFSPFATPSLAMVKRRKKQTSIHRA